MSTIDEIRTYPSTGSSTGDVTDWPRFMQARARAMLRAAEGAEAPPRRRPVIAPRHAESSPRLTRWCTDYDER